MKSENQRKTTPILLFAIFSLVTGVILMGYKIVSDSEPGAIPLLLILPGGFYFARFQPRWRNRTD